MARIGTRAGRTGATQLSAVLHTYRVVKDIGLRTLSKEIGVSAATLMRLEHGHKPDADTLLKLLTWLLAQPHD